MVVINKRRFGLRYAEIWFPDESFFDIKADIFRLHCAENTSLLPQKYWEKHKTLLTDLKQSEETLRNVAINKSVAYEIRRSENDALRVKYFTSEDILENDEILTTFAQTYDQMYKSKGLDIQLDKTTVFRCAQVKALLLSVTYVCDTPVVFHSYICDKNKVILWHSCSTFRDGDKTYANVISRANKRLHWEDWIYFKNTGRSEYDWGGVFAFSSENGIDRFKQSFGGVPHEYFTSIPVGKNLFGKFAVGVFKVVNLYLKSKQTK